jgi:hypothetical protein
MVSLLQSNLRFSDLFLRNKYSTFAYIVIKIPSDKIDDEALRLELAKEFYQLATGDYFDQELKALINGKKCPSKIRFVCHSMGGMMAARYVSESNFYPNGGSPLTSINKTSIVTLRSDTTIKEPITDKMTGLIGFYKRNLDYTQTKFLEDLKHQLVQEDTLGALLNANFYFEKTINNIYNFKQNIIW